MNKQEKIQILADVFDMEIEELNEDVVLEELDTWDSVAVLSIIAVVGEHFDKYLLADDIKNYKTIGDIMKVMEK